MTVAANKVAEGEIDTEIPVIKSGDEVEDLSSTLTMMVGAIRYLKKGEDSKKRDKEKK